MEQLCDILGRHVYTLLVKDSEGAGDGGVVELMAGWEQLAADYGIKMVAAVPEAPFFAEVGGKVN